jgi:hypothetical protein
MGADGAYVFKGYGQIESGWLLGFFKLFKSQSVNIRKLVLLKESHHPTCLSILEVHFTPPAGDGRKAFLELLTRHIALQSWQIHSLTALSPC